jgi:hypothetical protein
MSRNKATGEEESTMLFTPEAIKAEDKYRREILRDQYQTQPTRRARNVVVALVVAGAVALAACGIPAETEVGAPNVITDQPSSILTDPGPSWAPNLPGPVIPTIEFGGMPAPGSWQSIETAVLSAHVEADMGSVNNTEPVGHPNYGRLQTYLGAQSVTGPR